LPSASGDTEEDEVEQEVEDEEEHEVEDDVDHEVDHEMELTVQPRKKSRGEAGVPTADMEPKTEEAKTLIVPQGVE